MVTFNANFSTFINISYKMWLFSKNGYQLSLDLRIDFAPGVPR